MKAKTLLLTCVTLSLLLVSSVPLWPSFARTLNILEYRDTISDSAPEAFANHAIEFVVNTNVSPGGVIEITPPDGFEIIATSTFDVRNIELVVNNTRRTSGAVVAPGVDGVEITTGSPGKIRYVLNPVTGLQKGDRLKLLIGNNTSQSEMGTTTFDEITGTTTIPADIEPIKNSSQLGRHDVLVEIYDGGLVATARPIIYMIEKVRIPNIDTREEIPPFRFNGQPSGNISGTSLSVEVSVETDEFAWCRYSLVPDVAFGSMSNVFTNTGLIIHTVVIPVTPNTQVELYVRCIDDEGNFNTDDYLIQFFVNEIPTGETNEDGANDGDGSGSGDSGTEGGSGSGGTSGDNSGSSSGGGGSGGGGGGGTGPRTGGTAGGGFEGTDGPFQSGDGRVVISGFAYPNSTVTILVDGQIAASTRAGGSGQYEITIDGIARGAYTFGVYAAGPNNVRSSTFSTSFTVTGARTSALSNINVAPSIRVEPDPVNPGQVLTLTGYSLPNATVQIETGRNNTSSKRDLTATSNSSGLWTTTVETNSFTTGTYRVRARAVQTNGAQTNFSEYTFYGVGQSADLPLNTDLNRDGRVNLVDFSILLFWWNGNGGDSDPPADINRDGRVNLIDFSILLFNWTG